MLVPKQRAAGRIGTAFAAVMVRGRVECGGLGDEGESQSSPKSEPTLPEEAMRGSLMMMKKVGMTGDLLPTQ